MYTVIIGLIMIVVFMALILSKRVSAFTALVIVPIVFGFIAGFGTDTFTYAMKGCHADLRHFVFRHYAVHRTV